MNKIPDGLQLLLQLLAVMVPFAVAWRMNKSAAKKNDVEAQSKIIDDLVEHRDTLLKEIARQREGYEARFREGEAARASLTNEAEHRRGTYEARFKEFERRLMVVEEERRQLDRFMAALRAYVQTTIPEEYQTTLMALIDDFERERTALLRAESA